MLFNSFEFLFFFVFIYLLYLLVNKKKQNILLLVSSYFFYGFWNYKFLALIFISTVVDYLCGLKIAEIPSVKTKKQLMTLSIISNLGTLCFFKYFNFFIDSVSSLLAVFGLAPSSAPLEIILPVGISFYTFQTMSYTIDIYRGRLQPTKKFIDFALFVSFFPQLVAGPIERARNLLPQVSKKRIITETHIKSGLYLILLGYFKKVVLADSIAPYVDGVLNAPGSADPSAVLWAVYGFAFQIYGDFSGYSDIARGLSKLLGFELMINFKMPYFAKNPSDFWKRWHISLSEWLRDYLYIPLGGSHSTYLHTIRNLMITMFLGGLWHGASWNFAIWGIFHGFILAIFHWMNELKLKIPVPSLLKIFFMFHLTCIGWVFFRIQNLTDIVTVLKKMPFGNPLQPTLSKESLFVILLLLVLQIYKESHKNLDEFAFRSRKINPTLKYIAIYITLFTLIVLFGAVTSNEFIYFQF